MFLVLVWVLLSFIISIPNWNSERLNAIELSMPNDSKVKRIVNIQGKEGYIAIQYLNGLIASYDLATNIVSEYITSLTLKNISFAFYHNSTYYFGLQDSKYLFETDSKSYIEISDNISESPDFRCNYAHGTAVLSAVNSEKIFILNANDSSKTEITLPLRQNEEDEKIVTTYENYILSKGKNFYYLYSLENNQLITKMNGFNISKVYSNIKIGVYNELKTRRATLVVITYEDSKKSDENFSKYYLFEIRSEKLVFDSSPLEFAILSYNVYSIDFHVVQEYPVLTFDIRKEGFSQITGVYDVSLKLVTYSQRDDNKKYFFKLFKVNDNSFKIVKSISGNKALQLCPFFKDGKNCNLKCASKTSLIDNQEGNKCIDSDEKREDKYSVARIDGSKFFVNECPRGYEINANLECVRCPDEKKYFLNDKCIEYCPEKMFSDSLNNCHYCTDYDQLYFKGKCVDFCPMFYAVTPDYKECKRCWEINSTTPFISGEKCVEQCESNQYNNETKACYKCVDEEKPYEDFVSTLSIGSCISTCGKTGSGIGLFDRRCIRCFSESKMEHLVYGTCVDKCDMVYNSEKNKCQGCENGYYFDTKKNECVASCDEDDYVNEKYKKCYYCMEGQKHFQDECLDECPEYTVEEVSKECVLCENIFDTTTKSCVDECPYRTVEFVTSSNITICKHCDNSTYYDPLTKKCLSKCPSGYEPNDSTMGCEPFCFESCEVCSTLGNLINHNCINCQEGYHPLEDKLSQCYKEKGGYFLNDLMLLEHCYQSCETCSERGTEADHKCTSCKKGYYQREETEKEAFNCYKKFQVENNFTISTSPINEEEYKQKFDNFSKASPSSQISTIEESISNITTKQSYKEKLNEIIYTNRLLTVSKENLSTSRKQTYEEKVAKELESLNLCGESRESSKDVILSLLALYYSTKNMDKNTIYSVNKMIYNLTACFVEDFPEIIEHLSIKEEMTDNKLSIITSDYSDSLSNIMSNMVDARRNSNYRETDITEEDLADRKNLVKKSLVVVDETLKLKRLTESLSVSLIDLDANKENYFWANYSEIISKKIPSTPEEDIILFPNVRMSVIPSLAELSQAYYSKKMDKMRKQDAKLAIILLPQEEESFLSVISYSKYPLLHPDISDVEQNVMSVKVLNKNKEPITDFRNNNVTLIFRKTNRAFNECIFFDESASRWNNKNCETKYNDDKFIACSCTHLTDFSLTLYPLYLVYDVANLLRNSRIMDSFAPFKNFSFKKAPVAIVYLVLFIILVVGLALTLRFDLKFEKDFFVSEEDEEEECCCSKESIQHEIKEIKTITDKEIKRKKESVIQKYFQPTLDGRDGRKRNQTILHALGIKIPLDKENKESPAPNDTPNDTPDGAPKEDPRETPKQTPKGNIFRRILEKKKTEKKEKEQSIEVELTDKSINISQKLLENEQTGEKNDENYEKETPNQTTVSSFSTESNDSNYSTRHHKHHHHHHKHRDKDTKSTRTEKPIKKTKTSKSLDKPRDPKTEQILEEINNMRKQKLPFEVCYRVFYILKLFFCSEYRLLVIFLPKIADMTKTNTLILIIIRLSASLSICALLSECNEKDDKQEMHFDRGLIVSIATILIIEIPFTIFELLMFKMKVSEKKREKKWLIKSRAIGIQILIYIIFGIIFILGMLNTIWISLTKEEANEQCQILNDFLLSTVFDNFVYEILIIFTKSIFYLIITKDKKITFCKRCLIGILAAMPWVFALNG